MLYGNKPTDGGNLILSTDEKDTLIVDEPLAKQYIRPFIGAEEFINGNTRWCLWFHDVADVKRNNDLKKMPKVRTRIQAVKAMREASSKAATQKKRLPLGSSTKSASLQRAIISLFPKYHRKHVVLFLLVFYLLKILPATNFICSQAIRRFIILVSSTPLCTMLLCVPFQVV